ncbi:hypothetical protein AgCh_037558 [Apium graveolens]
MKRRANSCHQCTASPHKLATCTTEDRGGTEAIALGFLHPNMGRDRCPSAGPKAQPMDRDMLVIGPIRPIERRPIKRLSYWAEGPSGLRNEGPRKPRPRPTTRGSHDLLWAVLGRDIKGWAKNEIGVSTFGADRVDEFLDLICRAYQYQVVEGGYKFFAGQKLLTIFSAPCYCSGFDCAGAMLSVNQELECTFKTLKASKKQKFGS